MRGRLFLVLTSWPFLCALVLLLLNDWWLKAAHPGLVSGKLSDFAGIAVVGLFLLAMRPDRPLVIYAACTLAFAWWKGPLSQPFIEMVNACAPVRIGRTVDYSDLIALLGLPACSRVVAHPGRFALPWRRVLLVPVVMATVFGTAATSVVPTHYEPPEHPGRDHVHEVITNAVARHGLACDECPSSDDRMVFRGTGVTMSYRWASWQTVYYTVEGSSPEKVEAVRSAVRSNLAQVKHLHYSIEAP